MRVLFVLNRLAHVRHFDRPVRLLAERGHHIVLASQDDDLELEGTLANTPRITAVAAPRSRRDDWTIHAAVLRRTRDYLRYLHPRYASATQLRRRAFEKLMRVLSDREIGPDDGEALLALGPVEQKRLNAALEKVESVIPRDPGIDEFLRAQAPDALVLSPMVGLGFTQADFVKSARGLGIPTGVLVFSWDNLSNKGLIHELPDRLFVWNDIQRREAVKLHRCPAERIVVTGAPRFDALFEMRPATTREEFCGLVGIDPARSTITYLCSSKFVVSRERVFIERWLAEIRRDPRLAECNVVVRPHPGAIDAEHAEQRTLVRWPDADRTTAAASRSFADPRTVVLSSPMQNADQVLYDTVYHSAAIVGLNTSAEIEAGIIGRPVFTVVDPDAEAQEATLHFRYLLHEHGGHVRLAGDFDEHRRQLADATAGTVDHDALARFIEGFVRPGGADVPVAPLVAQAIEGLAELRGAASAPAPDSALSVS
jgi:hypothetical protein